MIRILRAKITVKQKALQTAQEQAKAAVAIVLQLLIVAQKAKAMATVNPTLIKQVITILTLKR